MQYILILGAGYAGLMTALRLQPVIRREQARVTLVNARADFTERIRLHQLATGQTLKRHSIYEFLRGTGVEFVQDYVTCIEPEAQEVTLSQRSLRYDVLVVALGSHVNKDAVRGIREHAYTLDLKSAQQLRERMSSGGRLLVIGGGLTGIEAATEFAERQDVDVHLATHGLLGTDVSQAGRAYLLKTLSDLNITLHQNVEIDALHADHATHHAGRIDFDVCLWAGGVNASPLVAEAGFAVDGQGRILVQETLQAHGHANIYGVGDVAAIQTEAGQPLRMTCAAAMPVGTHAADNIANVLSNRKQNPLRFGYALQCVSMGRRKALVQLMTGDGTPKEHIVTGTPGRFIKEAICRYTIFSLRMEKRFPGSFRYPKRMTAMDISTLNALPAEAI